MFDLFRSRDKLVRILLGGLLGIVGLSMVTYLIPTTGAGTGNRADESVLATVGKDTLTSQEVSRVVQNMTRSRQMPPELLAIYVPQIVQQMISERALAYEATNRLGLRVTSDEVDNAILDTLPPDMVKGGKVDTSTLNAILQQQGVNMAGLKEDTTRQLLVNRLREIVAEGVIVSPADIEVEFRHRYDKFKIEYAIISPDKYRAEAEPTDAEIKAYYDAHKALFQTPEKRSLAIIILDPARIVGTIHPSAADLQREYNANENNFRTPERVQVRHILIKSDAATDAAMKAKAEGVLKQVQAGGDFAKIAKENSQDPGSAANGGELGWIQKGQTVPEFEKSAFSLQPGQTSGLVKTTYGYHIIQVEKHEQARLQPFEDVQGQLTYQYTFRMANQQMQKLADKAIAELRKDPLHPEKAAAAVGTMLIRAENIQAGDPIPEIGVSKDFNDAVASLRKGEVAGPVAIPGNKAALASVTDYDPAHQASFEEAKSDVRNRAAQEKLQAIVAQKAKDLLAKARGLGGDLQKAGKEMGMEIKTSTDVDRNGAVEGVGQATTFADAFTKPVNSLLGPIPISAGQVVAKVISKTPADLSGLPAQEAGIREELKQRKARDRAQLFEAGLKQRLEQEGKLKVHSDVVSRLVRSYTAHS